KVRPGHFRGVATVCAKLFNIVQPDRAFFGQKDYQQLTIIKRLVTDLCLPLTIEAVPTVREADGLAMSSRNAYLSPEERIAATVGYRSLQSASALFRAGERSAARLAAGIFEELQQEPLARPDYAVVVDVERLDPVDKIRSSAAAL